MESRLRQTLRNLQLIATYMISDCESPIIFHFSFDIFHLPFKRLWFAILILVRPDESPRRGLFQWANEKCQMTNGKWFGLVCLLLTVHRFRFRFAQLFQSGVSLSAKGTLRMLSDDLRKV